MTGKEVYKLIKDKKVKYHRNGHTTDFVAGYPMYAGDNDDIVGISFQVDNTTFYNFGFETTVDLLKNGQLVIEGEPFVMHEHDYKKYVGLTETYHYCNLCGIKI